MKGDANGAARMLELKSQSSSNRFAEGGEHEKALHLEHEREEIQLESLTIWSEIFSTLALFVLIVIEKILGDSFGVPVSVDRLASATHDSILRPF